MTTIPNTKVVDVLLSLETASSIISFQGGETIILKVFFITSIVVKDTMDIDVITSSSPTLDNKFPIFTDDVKVFIIAADLNDSKEMDEDIDIDNLSFYSLIKVRTSIPSTFNALVQSQMSMMSEEEQKKREIKEHKK